MTDADAKALLDKTAKTLGEHFDAVVLMATWPAENGNTRVVKTGSGNYYTRMGMVQEFCREDNARDHAIALESEIRKHIDPPDSSEEWRNPS